MEPLAGMMFGMIAKPAVIGFGAVRRDCDRSYRKQGRRQANVVRPLVQAYI